MTEQEVREALKMFANLFPLHPRQIVILSQESAQELLDAVDRLVPGLKTLIEQTTKVEVLPRD